MHLAVNAVPSGKSVMSMLWPRSIRARPCSRWSCSKQSFSRNLKKSDSMRQSGRRTPAVRETLWEYAPLSQQEVVGLDVGVYDPGLVQLLHHVQDADGEVQHQRLRHHLLTAALVQVYSALEDDTRQHHHHRSATAACVCPNRGRRLHSTLQPCG